MKLKANQKLYKNLNHQYFVLVTTLRDFRKINYYTLPALGSLQLLTVDTDSRKIDDHAYWDNFKLAHREVDPNTLKIKNAKPHSLSTLLTYV